MPATRNLASTGNAVLDAMFGNVAWASSVTTLTYSFPTLGTQYEADYSAYADNDEEPDNAGFAALTGNQQTFALYAMNQAASFLALNFAAASGGAMGDIAWAQSNKRPDPAFAYEPNTLQVGGDIWINNANQLQNMESPQIGTYASYVMLHEFGHSLGLGHPHAEGMPADSDSHEYTVMTYHSYIGQTGTALENQTFDHPQTYMMYDIVALQVLYGADYTTNAGDTWYSFDPNTGQMFVSNDGGASVGQGVPSANRIFRTIWDGDGEDTYDLSNYTTDLTINLAPGESSVFSTAQLARLNQAGTQLASGNVYNALRLNSDDRSLIENAMGGAGSDTFTGNSADNKFRGYGGNDTADGRDGNDTFYYDAGFDTYTGGLGVDYARFDDLNKPVWIDLTYNGSEVWTRGSTLLTGTWTAVSEINEVEGFVGTGYNDEFKGNALQNYFYGHEGDDLIHYAGGALDLYFGEGGTDTVDFSAVGSKIWIDLADPSSIDAWYMNNGTWRNAALLIDIEIFIGTAYDDTFRADETARTYNGGIGNDTFSQLTSRSVFNGGDGVDTVDFSRQLIPIWVDLGYAGAEAWTRGSDLSNVSLTWAEAADISGIENVIGTAYSDKIWGTTGNNVITAGGSGDLIGYTGGFDRIDGGDAVDTVDFSRLTMPVWVSLVFAGDEVWTRGATLDSGTWTAVANLDNVENLTGTAYGDYLEGNTGNNIFDPGAGNDDVRGGDGDDGMFYTSGFDLFSGGIGANSIDFTRLTKPVWVNLSYSGAEAWTRGADLASGTWTAVADLSSVENISGTFYDDYLEGDASANRFIALSGNDIVKGGAGNDTIYYVGESGFDQYDGGADVDVVDFSFLGRALWVDLASGAWTRSGATLESGTWTQVASLANIELVVGTPYGDFLQGAQNVVNSLVGGAGVDTLIDFLDGDTMLGQADADTFKFLKHNGAAPFSASLFDYQPFLDKLDLSGIDAVSSTAVDDAFTYSFGGAFSGSAGSLRYNSTNLKLEGDWNGDGVADFGIALNTPVEFGDLIL